MASKGVHSAMSCYQGYRLLVEKDLVAIQPQDPALGSQNIPTLSINIATGKVNISEKERIGEATTSALSILGLLTLSECAALVVVTGAEKVAVLDGCPIYQIVRTEVFTPSHRISKQDQRLLRFFREATDPCRLGNYLYFSFQLDLTLSCQRKHLLSSDPERRGLPMCHRAEKLFFFNRHLSQPIMSAGGGATPFVVPVIQGFVGHLGPVEVLGANQQSLALEVLLIARRSAMRIGTRHWRRGVDTQGYAANFVESEQILLVNQGQVLSSYVQVRGSIPLLWTQIPNIKYKPTTKILDPSNPYCSQAFDKHFDLLLSSYKNCDIINLVNQKGSEGRLASAFKEQALRYANKNNAGGISGHLRYVAFDFHHECGATNYGRLDKLMDQLADDLQSFGMFTMTGGSVQQCQQGVMRVNCIDCLDRTNVVQGVLARRALDVALRSCGALAEGKTLAECWKEVDRLYKILWADHGDAISQQYAGTGALKSGFTRTGKRTLGGMVDDGVKSIVRYYLNNFQDGKKQDALDLITGAFTLQPQQTLKWQRKRSPALPFLAILTAITIGVVNLFKFPGDHEGSPAVQLLIGVVCPWLAAALMGALVVANGRYLVTRPQLCPKLADTLTK